MVFIQRLSLYLTTALIINVNVKIKSRRRGRKRETYPGPYPLTVLIYEPKESCDPYRLLPKGYFTPSPVFSGNRICSLDGGFLHSFQGVPNRNAAFRFPLVSERPGPQNGRRRVSSPGEHESPAGVPGRHGKFQNNGFAELPRGKSSFFGFVSSLKVHAAVLTPVILTGIVLEKSEIAGTRSGLPLAMAILSRSLETRASFILNLLYGEL
jgi:hypothetical protein